MKTHIKFGVPVLALVAFAVVGVTVSFSALAHAQTYYTSNSGVMYTVPSGFEMSSYGTFFNPVTKMYYDPLTGQYSSTAASGPAAMDVNGAYIVPSGYTSSIFGTYYSPITGLYYDPIDGFYSNSAPVGPTITNSITAPAVNPGLPNTGAGGDARGTVALLAIVAGIGVVSIAVAVRRLAHITALQK
jgi:hypothetical protein